MDGRSLGVTEVEFHFPRQLSLLQPKVALFFMVVQYYVVSKRVGEDEDG